MTPMQASQKATRPMRQMFSDLREALKVVWELLKRRPFLASIPSMFVVRIAFRKDLDRWVDEAIAAVAKRQTKDA